MKRAVPAVERIKAHLSMNADGCWLHGLAKDRDGYGAISERGKSKRAHIVMYESVHGKVPLGLQLDHLCRVRCCVNPDHLEPVTGSVNIRRGIGPRLGGIRLQAINAERNAKRTHCPHGHAYTADNCMYHHGLRECRTCNRNRSRAWRMAKRTDRHEARRAA